MMRVEVKGDLSAIKRLAERNELIRQAAARVIENAENGRVVDPVTLAWARQFCAEHRPLGRPLGTGAPDSQPL